MIGAWTDIAPTSRSPGAAGSRSRPFSPAPGWLPAPPTSRPGGFRAVLAVAVLAIRVELAVRADGRLRARPRPRSRRAPASSASARCAPSARATASSPTTRRSPTPRLGERDAALAELRSLLGRRLGIVPARGTGLDSLWDDPEFQAVREQLAAEEPRTADAPVSFRLADPRLVPEGIAWDGARRRFLVGSIAQRKIVAIDRARQDARLLPRRGPPRHRPRPGGRTARRRLLYAVSTNGFEDSARNGRRNAVLIYDLGRGRRVARHDVAEALQLNDVAVAADGTLYVTDSAAGSIYRMRPGERRLTLFGTARAARGANGIAVAPDGTVYVTLSTGIGRVDPRDGSLVRLPQPDSVVSGGIDGLYWHEGDLDRRAEQHQSRGA